MSHGATPVAYLNSLLRLHLGNLARTSSTRDFNCLHNSLYYRFRLIITNGFYLLLMQVAVLLLAMYQWKVDGSGAATGPTKPTKIRPTITTVTTVPTNPSRTSPTAVGGTIKHFRPSSPLNPFVHTSKYISLVIA